MITFLLGGFALLIWLYATSGDRLALRLLWIGLVYLLVASLLNALLWLVGTTPPLSSLQWWFGLELVLFSPLIEEILKSRAARSQGVPIHSFALVCLFGILELMLSKPLIMPETSDWTALTEALDTIPALAMHTLTAAIYSFAFTGYRKVQFAICVSIHGALNGLWFIELYDLLPIVGAMTILATAWLYPWNDEGRKGRWGSA